MRIKHKRGTIIAKRGERGLNMALNIIEHDICTPIPYPFLWSGLLDIKGVL